MNRTALPIKNWLYYPAYGAAIAAIYVALTMIVAADQLSDQSSSGFQKHSACCRTLYPVQRFQDCYHRLLSCPICSAGQHRLDVVFGSIATLIGAVGSYCAWQEE